METMKKLQKNSSRNQLLIIIFSMIFGFILITILINKLYYQKKSEDLKTRYLSQIERLKNQPDVIVKRDSNIAPFINPLFYSEEYHQMCFYELSSFRDDIDQYISNALKKGSIQSIGFYFRDLTNGMWFGVNEKEKFIPASLNKIIILIGVLKDAQTNPSLLDEKIKFTGSDEYFYLENNLNIDMPRSKLVFMKDYTIRELLSYMITNSDNEATTLLFEKYGRTYFDQIKNDIGFKDKTNNILIENVLSPKVLSNYFRILYNSSYLNDEMSSEALHLLSHAEYGYGIRKAIPKEIEICQKFGQMDTILENQKVEIRQLHHAAIIYYPCKPYLICIMTKGTNHALMEKAIYDLSKITYEEIDKQVKAMPKNYIERDIQ